MKEKSLHSVYPFWNMILPFPVLMHCENTSEEYLRMLNLEHLLSLYDPINPATESIPKHALPLVLLPLTH